MVARMQKLDAVSSDILAAIAAADNLDTLDVIRIDALGKKGRISLMMRNLGGFGCRVAEKCWSGSEQGQRTDQRSD